jgi:hypothetical protein
MGAPSYPPLLSFLHNHLLETNFRGETYVAKPAPATCLGELFFNSLHMSLELRPRLNVFRERFERPGVDWPFEFNSLKQQTTKQD